MASPPNRLFSDWRISVLVLVAVWAVIYMIDLSRPPLLDDVDSVHAEAGRDGTQVHATRESAKAIVPHQPHSCRLHAGWPGKVVFGRGV